MYIYIYVAYSRGLGHCPAERENLALSSITDCVLRRHCRDGRFQTISAAHWGVWKAWRYLEVWIQFTSTV